MLMVIANIWFSISNFLAAIVTTMEGSLNTGFCGIRMHFSNDLPLRFRPPLKLVIS